ncbi:transposase [Escherichia coli]|uniref:helix-turn-helix domain-containing protein n=1 Tax=Escherichia coli TaxID=562 RepID=UPI0003EE4EDD|nr:helix-turn-helix domain-containing protein [Escherichia coli]UJY22417.1 helix-turn-helix domain containing protein [Escherichia coli]
MEKFSLEFKKVVSEKYLEGELSLKSVARMYGISPCTVRKWAYAYREHGISILTGKKGVTGSFKPSGLFPPALQK